MNGRYEAYRSFCIRFLSADHGYDDVIWLQVVMRSDGGDHCPDTATIVCWNHVIDQQAVTFIILCPLLKYLKYMTKYWP